jgi:S-adenosylmethionine:tRNA ribosyltransferase-isomerase
MKSDDVLQHTMHKENILIEQKFIEQLKLKNEIVAVGTTTLRTLESLYWIGVRLIKKESNPFFVPQFYALENQHLQISKADSMQAILNYLHENNLSKIEAATQIMCLPSYEFKIVKRLITNFHQPKSTLLLLIAAFVGDVWKKIYDYALQNNFRFLSYVDSSLLTLKT